MATITEQPLSDLLAARRAALGLSQEVAAVQLGTTRNTYAKWESGEATPEKIVWISPIADWLETDQMAVLRSIRVTRAYCPVCSHDLQDCLHDLPTAA